MHTIGLWQASHSLLGKSMFSLVQKNPVLNIILSFQQLSNYLAVLIQNVQQKSSKGSKHGNSQVTSQPFLTQFFSQYQYITSIYLTYHIYLSSIYLSIYYLSIYLSIYHLLRERQKERLRERERQRRGFTIRNWFMQLWRLKSPKTCSWQAGDPREPMV